MQFAISHDFDAPLESLEQAVMAQDLGPLFARQYEAIETVEALEHEVDEACFRRVWRFRAKAPLKVLSGLKISRQMLSWDEHSRYGRASHRATWHVIPQGDDSPRAHWRKHFNAAGSYQLDSLAAGRTRRTVKGELVVRPRLIGVLVERAAIAELRRAYAAEAAALRLLCGRAGKNEKTKSA